MKNRRLWVSIVAGLLVLAMLLGLIVSLIPTASAASSSEIKKQIEDLQAQKKELQSQIDDLEAQQDANLDKIAGMVEQKDKLDQQVGILYTQVENINQQIASYNVLIADTQDELDEAEARLAELNEKNRERIRAMEEDGNLSYWSVLFKASSFSDLLDRLSMIEEIAAADQRRLKEMSAAAQAVSEAKDALTAERAEAEAAKAELDAAQAELDIKRAEADELINQLLAKGDEYAAMLEEIWLQEQEMQDSIADKEDELDEAKKREYQQWLSTSVPPTTKPSSSGSGSSANIPSSSGWIRPCTYKYVSSPYGWRKAPTAGASSFHRGIDLAGTQGTPIYAAKSGTVTLACYDRLCGWMVKIDHHDGFSSVYEHMTNFVVKAGDIVSQGQLIGYMGSTGTASTGVHLHFGIFYEGTAVNPAEYLNF